MTAFRLLAASILCSSLFLSAQDPPKPGEKPPAAAPAKPAPVYVIAKTGDKLEVMTKEELEKKNKHLAEEYTKAMTAYEKEKKDAEAAKKKFEGKEPKKTVIEAVGSEHPTKDAAEAAMKKMHDEKAKSDEKAKEPKKDDKKKDK